VTAGYYSPLPPARTGVADYAASLLGELRKHGTVDISPAHCDVALYQLGNNQLHREIYARALESPGVAVLHDAVLQHFFLGSLSREDYIAEFVHNYGEWAREEADTLWRERSSSAQDPRYFARPMLKRIAERSKAIVVHNAAAAEMVREHAPDALVVTIPHLYAEQQAADESAVLAFRARLGIPPRAFLFGLFGYLRESKRVIPLLKAFEQLHRARPGVRLLVAGEFVSEDLARAAAPLLDLAGVGRIGYLHERDFQLAAAAVDCCVNLRYPRAGETSGILVRLMGAGKPVIVTDGAETDDLPATACFRVPPGVAEQAALLEYMVVASEYPEVAREMGRQAAEHIRRYHSLTPVGALYWKLLCDTCSSLH
jgi:glycosyltransferase involved in cell wall biosynthesis